MPLFHAIRLHDSVCLAVRPSLHPTDLYLASAPEKAKSLSSRLRPLHINRHRRLSVQIYFQYSVQLNSRLRPPPPRPNIETGAPPTICFSALPSLSSAETSQQSPSLSRSLGPHPVPSAPSRLQSFWFGRQPAWTPVATTARHHISLSSASTLYLRPVSPGNNAPFLTLTARCQRTLLPAIPELSPSLTD